uniref:HepT-like ribonuclease domain-containing protein n=1 Tax=Mariniflexile sp. TaxID=1979402 RepID=UPI0040480150
MGEATKKISLDFKIEWHDIPWKNMARMRDRLIHDYIGVNYAIVYDVIKNKIPAIHKQISDFLNQNG